jgi:hypothetical protein
MTKNMRLKKIKWRLQEHGHEYGPAEIAVQLADALLVVIAGSLLETEGLALIKIAGDLIKNLASDPKEASETTDN